MVIFKVAVSFFFFFTKETDWMKSYGEWKKDILKSPVMGTEYGCEISHTPDIYLYDYSLFHNSNMQHHFRLSCKKNKKTKIHIYSNCMHTIQKHFTMTLIYSTSHLNQTHIHQQQSPAFSGQARALSDQILIRQVFSAAHKFWIHSNSKWMLTHSAEVAFIMTLMNWSLQQKPNHYNKHRNVFADSQHSEWWMVCYTCFWLGLANRGN